ncbi:Bug family tripartite tricarboxylate transporter substrate binding protein [Rhodoplanes sp. Z2-YC6860]|uniref:Bug family tripartite tricarboxylate transporter substrate binding protein n=1 Tax=Rhodoplanes sp. Z2-YC6860 TaxID=674703 RepID=UPI00078DD8FA|nr:tripartite tricarboxylate transporter substrate binding protein [Rhodoplanes sp. Z2-YC6860]AMN40809.1 extracytoplasmic binding receptor [Rhodoplanes sp. Z2-YC6860]
MTTRRQFVQLAAAAVGGATLPGAAFAQAQAWPTRPIRAMIPFAAGSSLDIVGRIVMDPLSAQLGQPIVIENRGGAGGTIGTALVAKSDPDGYSILIQASAHSAAPAAYSNIGYDVANDFIAVIPFGTLPNVTVVSPASGIKTLKQLVEKAKSSTITYASAGTGSATHWAAERIRVAGGFQGTHVPFRGGPDALTEVMTGRVDFTSMGMSSALPLIKDGKLVPLAVSTTKRSSALPDVPTTIEAGLPDSDYTYWMGLFVPAKTPEAIVTRLRSETEKALKNPNVIEKFGQQGIEPMPMSTADFNALIRKEIQSNIALVKAAGLKFN